MYMLYSLEKKNKMKFATTKFYSKIYIYASL